MSVNYVMACYFGNRDNVSVEYINDPMFYVMKHIESLERLPHKLDQITIVCSGGNPGLKIPNRIRDTYIVVLERPNLGLSYGAFSDTFEKYRSGFSHYIFTEDDYVFTHDNFDTLLVSEYELKNCGMICGYSSKILIEKEPESWKMHAAVFITMSGSDVLEKMRVNVYCPEHRLPYLNRPDMFAGYFAQKAMSFAVVDTGHTLVDWTDKWSTAYWNSADRIVRWFGTKRRTEPWLGDIERRVFVVPIQAITSVLCKVSDGLDWHTGTVDDRGFFRSVEE